MIYPENKNSGKWKVESGKKNTSSIKFECGQTGVTLLLSVLILAAISAVAFSVSAVMMAEIRTSGDVARTDVSYYNDQAMYEEALFAFKRNISSIKNNYGTLVAGQSCSTFSTAVAGPVAGSNTRTRRCLFNSEHVTTETIPTTANTYASAKRFYLYDPANLTPGSQAGGFRRIKLTNLGASQLSVSICKLDVFCLDPETAVLHGHSFSTPLTLGTRDFTSLDINSSYEVIVRFVSGAQDGRVQIETFGPDTTTAKGRPYVGQENVEVEATRNGLTRRVRILVPTQ